MSCFARICAGLALAAFVTSGYALAQAPGDSKAVSVSKVERKNRAPVSKEILRVKLPRPVEAKLQNGMTVLILEDHRFPIVTVDFTIDGAGSFVGTGSRAWFGWCHGTNAS